ncbi:MAG: OmpA family protein [Candidatus Electrothrix aestuarii]|uniref:OmpA family protein n=1 Tax=Candidatus Electrothrix aestuarii TaxID=3062594 RepID=A0AAU8LV59_9BACT|nr:OmpA family protein [Candidatus Electrothrix aestuarii]
MRSRPSRIVTIVLLSLLTLSMLSVWAVAGGRKAQRAKKKPILRADSVEEAPPKYIRMADNFFVFYDPSTAMTVPYKDTGMTRLEMSKQILLKSNEAMPDLRWQTGLYPHWKNVMWLPASPGSFHPYYVLQNYEKKEFATALEKLPVISSGPPMLQMSLMKMEYLLGLPGRTEIFLFTNGEDARFQGVDEPAPLTQAEMLAKKYDVCFTIVSSATTPRADALLHRIAAVNDCSQVVDFDTVAAHPEYLFGRLYMTPDGLFDNVLFAFDKASIRKKYRNTLDRLGNYLLDNPTHYAVLSGFCDIIGTEKYNMRLSQRRAESAQKYLLNHFPALSKERILLYWYGYGHPVATNKTAAGRRLNRRVSIMIRKGY